MNKTTLKEEKELYKVYSDKIFTQVKIDIPIIFLKESNYMIGELQVENEKESNNNSKELIRLCNDLKDKINKKIINGIILECINSNFISSSVERTQNCKGSSLFYIYKEIIQIVNDAQKTKEHFKGTESFFRGQLRNWDLCPSLFREQVRQNLLENFDIIYQGIANKFPNQIAYVEDNGEERITELGLLQHYGFPTPLVDITGDPYIALRFMISESVERKYKANDFYNSRFDIFLINKKVHTESNIFTDVIQKNSNKRVIAQKGSFFDYSRIKEVSGKIEPIERITFDLRIAKEAEVKMLREKVLEEVKSDSEFSQVVENLFKSAEDEEYLNQEEESESKNKKEIEMQTIIQDLDNKLDEYYYHDNDLYPDFYKYLDYLSHFYMDLKLDYSNE